MSKKANLELEYRVLRTICGSDNEIVRSELLPLLSDDHFSSSATVSLYRRVSHILKTKGYLPSWRDLAHDPGIKREVRASLREYKVRPAKEKDEITSAYDTLDSLRKIRALYELGANLEEGLENQSVDLKSIVENLNKDLKSVTDGSTASVLTHIGEGSNALARVKKLLRTGGPTRVPTGFKGFDNMNIGIPRGSLVLLGANSGAGKSTMINKLEENMAMQGAHVAEVPLEMNSDENMQRRLARISGVDLTDLFDPLEKLSEKRRKEIYLKFKKRDDDIAAKGGRITTLEPRFAPSMENLLEYLKPLGYDVIFIDYVGLLDGVNGDDQWRALSNATAYAKLWAERNNCIVVVAVQITAEATIRYSQAMKEHASYAWFWTFPTQDDLDFGVTMINQEKGRMAVRTSFPVTFEWARMDVRDSTKEELEEYNQRKGSGGSGNARWKKGGKKDTTFDADFESEDRDSPPKSRDRGSSRSNVKQPRNRKSNDDEKSFEY